MEEHCAVSQETTLQHQPCLGDLEHGLSFPICTTGGWTGLVFLKVYFTEHQVCQCPAEQEFQGPVTLDDTACLVLFG